LLRPCRLRLEELGYETIMVNSNPETVSTDYDTSDKLYFEPLTFENVLDIAESENLTGHRAVWRADPFEPATALKKAGVKIIGTTPEKHRCRRGQGQVQNTPQETGTHPTRQRYRNVL